MIESRQRRPRRRRRSPVPWLIGLLAAIVLLAVGVAVGMALHDNPTPNLTVTTTKTILP